MTALIAATRAVPIFAPGCGDALAGGPSAPSYSVTVTKAEAEAARAAFAEEKAAKRMAIIRSNEALQKEMLDAEDGPVREGSVATGAEFQAANTAYGRRPLQVDVPAVERISMESRRSRVGESSFDPRTPSHTGIRKTKHQ